MTSITGSIPLNNHEVWPHPFWGGSSLQNKTPVDHSIGHIPFASLGGDKRPDKINQNPMSLNIYALSRKIMFRCSEYPL